MSREQVSIGFNCRRISVNVHQSASDKLAYLGLSLIPVKERERLSGKVSNRAVFT